MSVWRACTSVLLGVLAGCASVPPDAVTFAVLGDTPYTAGEVARLDHLIDDMNGERLAFVLHVGDIGSAVNACNDAWLEARKRQFARIRHDLVVIPGDNEWSDCPRQMERLASWRRFFCDVSLPVEHQSGEYCEHMRWRTAGWLFVTLNVQGSNNNVRNAAEHAHRMAAVLQWIDDSEALARKENLGLVLCMQADPFITFPHDGFLALRERLIALGARMDERVFLVHGDSHTYHDDEPIPGVRRLETWGSPIVSWIRGEVEGGRLRFSAPRYR